MYRLLADIFNDTAMVLECLSPAFPKPIRVTILATSSALKALCGVAAGSSKASLSAHFARWGNLGELNAKDSSQETVISLLGMLAGSAVVSIITTPFATWSTLMLLLSTHLAMNYRAVRSVSMRSLNRQRANIVFGNLLANDKLLTPTQVSQQERVFERDGAMRNAHDKIMGYARIGVSFGELVEHLEVPEQSRIPKSSMQVRSSCLNILMDIFHPQRAEYILWLDSRTRRCWIVLRQNCSVGSQLRAWYTSFVALNNLMTVTTTNKKAGTVGLLSTEDTLDVLRKAQLHTQTHFTAIEKRLETAGWDLNTAALETRSGFRIGPLTE